MSLFTTLLVMIGLFVISGLIGTCIILYVNIRHEMKKDHTLKLGLAVIIFLLIGLVSGLIGMLAAFRTMPNLYYGIVLFGFLAGLGCMALLSAGDQQESTL